MTANGRPGHVFHHFNLIQIQPVMITALRRLLGLAILLTLSHTTYAFNFNPANHIRVYYDFCEEDIVVEFLFFQSAGDNDRMNYLYFKHNPASGEPGTVIDFRHSSQYNNMSFTSIGNTFPYNSFGFKVHNSTDDWNFQIVKDSIWDETDHEGHKYWVRFLLRDLPESVFETFTVGGFWDGQGSNSPDLDINMTYPVNMYIPDAPGNLAASQGKCGRIVLSWTFDDFDPSCTVNGWKYYFRLYEGMNTNHFREILADPMVTSYKDSVYVNPSSTEQQLKSYRIRVVTKKPSTGSTIYQRSNFAGPVTGSPLALPKPPTSPTINYPDCEGKVTLNWQNPQIYDHVIVVLTPAAAPILTLTLSGSAITLTTIIDPGHIYTARVIGVDACGQQAEAAPVGNIQVPSKPGVFTLAAPTVENGAIRLNWSAAPGAESYTVVRSPDNAEFPVDEATTYLDVDARVCTAYSYKIRASNRCGLQNSNQQFAPLLSVDLDVWTNQKLVASKGYFGDRVELEWPAPNVYGFDLFRIYRKPVGSPAAATLLGTATKNETRYTDATSLAGTLYTYSLVAFSDCNNNPEESAALEDIGFRLPIAVVSGNVKFANGTGVDSVTMSVVREGGPLGKSLHLDGEGSLSMDPGYASDPLAVLANLPEKTIELWIRPDQLASNFSIIEYKNGDISYGLYYRALDSFLVQYVTTTINGIPVGQGRATKVHLETYKFTHLSCTWDQTDMALYVNGQPGNHPPSSFIQPAINRPLTFGSGFTGYLDEIRFWDKARTAIEISSTYIQILSGDEDHLAGYWPVDEGLGTGVYDVSGQDNAFHARHMIINNHVTWTTTIPEAYQLGNKVLTDSIGNYIVKNIRYSGVGSPFTVVPYYNPGGTLHEFDPASALIYLGEGNSVQNGVNFIDRSSFLVTGTVIYAFPDSMCINTKAFLYIDDQVAQVNGLPATVDPMTQTFAIDVPIGRHRISVKQAGHTFTNNGNWPITAPQHDFQADVSGLEFYDSTTVRVIGRVVGGTREAEKKLGFGRSTNNIGRAMVQFSSLNTCHEVTIFTDSLSGEYAVDLLPFKYNVSVTIPTNGDVEFNTSELDLGLIRPTLYVRDTVTNPGGQPLQIDSIPYNLKQNYIFRAQPNVDMVQADGNPLRGDTVFVFVDPDTRDTTLIPMTGLPYPVFIAGKRYKTIIKAFEEYQNKDNPSQITTDRVPVTDAEVVLQNELGNELGIAQGYEERLEIKNPDGTLEYTFIGGQPEFVRDTLEPEKSFTQVLNLELRTPSHFESWLPLPGEQPFRAFVLGSKPIPGTSFITEGPEMVDYILRDPPGDASSASFVEGNTYTNTYSWFTSQATTTGIKTHLKAGMEWFVGGGIVGIGFSTAIKVDNDLNIKTSLKTDVDGNYTESSTFEQEISTNSDPAFAGDASDIYLGKSYNYVFGAADELSLVPSSLCGVIEECVGDEILVNGHGYRLGKRRGLFVVPQSFRTTFVYTQAQIIDYVIPKLEDARNDLFATPEYTSKLNSDEPGFGLNNDDEFFGVAASTPTPDKTDIADFDGPSYTYFAPASGIPNDRIRWYNQQIKLWENAIARNEQLKLSAELDRNISFDAGASLSYSATRTRSDTYSEKFEVGVTTDNDITIGAVIAGSGGQFNFQLGLEFVAGTSFSQEETATNTYKYTLADSEPGDFFSIDVKDDLLGYGPIFSLRGGQSMCPWEQGYVTQYYQPGTRISEATIPREDPEIDVEEAFQNNIPRHQPARYVLKLRNNSPTGDIQWYGLRVLDQTNQDATLKIDGFSPNRVFEVPAGETLTKTLELYRGASDEYTVQLMFYSTCEYDHFQLGGQLNASDTVTLYAQFVPACSPVSVSLPVDQWIHNADDGQTITIQLSDYQLDDAGLEYLHLQYKPAYTSVWNGIESLWKTAPSSEEMEIPAGSTQTSFIWNIEELPDGPYDIRAVSHCNNTDNDYACPKATGIIDRLRPHAFGNPQPADGVLDPNDELLIRFNEPINPASVSITDFDVRAVLNGSSLRHETSVELDGVNDYIELPVGMRIGSHPFTFEAWIKRLSTGEEILWSQGEKADSSMAIGFNASNQLYFRWHDNLVASNATIQDNNWHHVAITANEEGVVTFFNSGSPAGDGLVDTLWSIPGNMVFGKAAWNNSQHFHGNIHEARIWRTELSQAIILPQILKKLTGTEAGLMALWPMDEGSGTVLREIVRKRNGTLLGSWVVEPSGYSLAFANTSIDVDAGTLLFDRQSNFSIEFWMKGGLTGQPQTILSNGKGDGTDANESGWAVRAGTAGRLLVNHGGQVFTVIPENVLDNDWHHVAIVLNRLGNLNTYLDGNLQTSIYGNAFGGFGGSHLWIGNRGWYEGPEENHDQFFSGKLDEIRIWSTKLTAEHIRASMSNRLAGDEFGLECYLPFEKYISPGGSPELIQDLSDQSMAQRDLSITGGPQFDEEDPNIKLTPKFEKVDFTWSVSGDEILITPTTDPLRLEKTLLFLSVRNIQDLHGNNMAGPISWTAFVNKNQLQWADDELYFEKPEKETLSFTADIVNSGGIELSYEILGLPDWLTCTVPTGTISPRSTKTLQFHINGDVNIGDYSTDINLLSGQGYNDKLAIDLHVFGIPPAWNFDPNAYPHSMTIVADLEIRGELSEDPLDRVVAYINGEVRGLATPEYLPELDRYLVFMEVYSHAASGEPITFKAWDAGTGTTYAGVNIRRNGVTNDKIPFAANSLYGNVVTPARFIVTNDITQEIRLNAGWTWISFNVLSPKFSDLDLFFDELTFEDGDAIHYKTKNADYNPSSGWQGNLKNDGLEIQKMYKCDFTYADILRVVGPRVNPDLYPITIVKGENWIPFLSAERIEINEALGSFTATAGDVVKSQSQVAVYHPTQGWVGTLKSMEPGMGYMLFADKAGTIIFPLTARGDIPFSYAEAVHEQAIKWRSGSLPNPIEGQERNMTVIARLESEVSIQGNPVIAAMTDGVLLDLLPGLRVEGTDNLYYFTLQASGPDRMVYFEVYDAEGQYAGLVDEKLYWSADQHLGSLEDPFILHLRADDGPAFEAYPNPFSETLYLEYEATQTGPVSIRLYDTAGRLVHTANETVVRPGLQKWTLSGNGSDGKPFVTGSYVVEIVQGETVIRRQLIRT